MLVVARFCGVAGHGRERAPVAGQEKRVDLADDEHRPRDELAISSIAILGLAVSAERQLASAPDQSPLPSAVTAVDTFGF